MAGDAERRYIIGSGWQTVAVSASGIVTAADVDSDGAANGEVLTADGAGAATWEVGGGGSLPAWWTVDSTPGSESFEVGEHRTLFGDGSETVISADGGAFTEYRSDEDDDENTGKVFIGIDDTGGDFFGEFTAWTGQDTVAERRVTLRTITSNDDQGNVYVKRLAADTSNFLVLMDENGDRFEVGPTGAVTVSPSDTGADPLSVQLDGGDVFKVYSGGRTEITPVPGSADFGPLLSISADAADLGADQLMRLRVDGDSVLEVGPTGAVAISPSDAAVPEAALYITLPIGSRDQGTRAIRVIGSDESNYPFQVDVYGAAELRGAGDGNGGGSIGLLRTTELDGARVFQFTADQGDGAGQAKIGDATTEIGFFGADPVPRPVAPADINDVIAGLQALGLFAV